MLNLQYKIIYMLFLMLGMCQLLFAQETYTTKEITPFHEDQTYLMWTS